MTLKLLDESARDRLRSGVAIRSMAHCVGELVENSIDAGATCIAVRVDTTKFKIQVVDNGKGISREDLNLLGKRYMTSKCHTVDDLEHNLHYLGYRGEALASIVDVSGVVEICSRHCLARDTYSRIFHNGRPMNVTLSKTHRPSVGTTITVHEFFYNMPVRRKVLSTVLELEQVKKAIECIALVNPSKSFSLRNDITGECILQTRKTYSVLTNFGLIFGGDKVACMKEVNCTRGDFVLTGYMSTEGHYNKLLQFIYVNGRLVKKTHLHTTVNNLLANSLLSRKLSRQIRDQPIRDYSVETMLSPKQRVVEAHGVYILMLKCLRSAYDVCLEPAKTLIEFQDWSEVLLTFEMLVKQFLSKHNLTLGPAAVINDTDRDEIQVPQSPADNSTIKTKQPLSVMVPSGEDSQACNDRQPVSISSLEMRCSLQSRVVKRTKKLCQQQTSACPTLTEEPSSIEDTDAMDTVQSDSSLSSLHSQEIERPPGATLCIPTARFPSEGNYHNNIEKSTSNKNLQQESLTVATQSCSTCGDIMPTFYPPISQSMTCYSPQEGFQSKLSSNVSTRSLNCSHSNLNQTPNSLFLTSFYSTTTNSPKEVETVTETQRAPHASSFHNKPNHSWETIQSKHRALSSHPTQLLSSASLPSYGMQKDGTLFPSAQKIILGLKAPVRSPLQSSLDSSKLAHLFKKRHQTSGDSYCTTVTQPSNLNQDFRQTVSTQPDTSSSRLTCLHKKALTLNSVAEISHQSESNSHLTATDTGTPQSCPSVSAQKNDTFMTQPCVENACSVHVVDPLSTVDVEIPDKSLVLCESTISPRLRALVKSAEELKTQSITVVDSDALNIEPQEALLSMSSPPEAIHSSSLLSSNNCPSSLMQTRRKFNVAQTVYFSDNQCDTTNADHASHNASQVECETATSNHPYTEPVNDHPSSHQDTMCITKSMPEWTASQRAMEDEVATALKPLWKECIDPVSKRKVFVHSKTGNVCTSIPNDYTPSNNPNLPPPSPQCHDVLSGINDSGLGNDSLSLDSSSVSSSISQFISTNNPSSTTTFGAKPLRAAPHLSHDFESFLPRPKHLRTSFATSKSCLDSANVTLQSILSDSCSTDMVDDKWRNTKEIDELRQSVEVSSNSSSFVALLEQWENPTFQAGDMEVLNVARDGRRRGQVKVHQVINQYKFTKDMFNNFKVLGQVDNKFIACLLDTKNSGVHNLLVMFDQHAAHERVRLEELLNNLYELRQESSQPLRIKSSQIQPPLTISLQPTEIRLAKLFRQQLEATGVSLLFDRGQVRVSSLPSVLMEREASEVKRGRPAVAATLLQEMIVKQLELLQVTSGGCSTIPSALIHVLNSQACHGAIKFGDPLTFDECESLIQSLSQCKLPFQCAHGRPSLIPVLDLDILNQRYPVSQMVAPPNFKRFADHQMSH